MNAYLHRGVICVLLGGSEVGVERDVAHARALREGVEARGEAGERHEVVAARHGDKWYG
jgi:hypothetical protein